MGSSKLLSTFSFLLFIVSSYLHSQDIGIKNGYPFSIPLDDTIKSDYFPNFPSEEAGKHGFVTKTDDGNLKFTDGTQARFFGTAVALKAAFPDSLQAITTAQHLKKLGVNLLRLEDIDNIYSWGQQYSFLEVINGKRLNDEQMRKLDWFIYQLKKNGIYSYITLQSARSAGIEDGIPFADSVLWKGTGMYQIFPQARAAHKTVCNLLLNHINPFTNKAYKDEPALAMIEIMNIGSYTSLDRRQMLNYNKAGYTLCYNHSRRVDTLFAEFLQKKYGSTAQIRNAWATQIPQGGFPNLLKEGGFEGEFEKYWSVFSNEATVTPILINNDSVPEGTFAMQLRIRNTKGNLYAAYMAQAVEMQFNKLYLLSFKAKCSNAQGREIIVQNNEAIDGGLYAGTSKKIMVAPFWQKHEIPMLLPIKPTAPIAIYFYFGDVDGELKFDDLQIREVEPAGLLPAESVEMNNIVRIPRGNDANYLVNSKRVQDQYEFYNFLDKDYQTDLTNHIRDIIGAKQLLAGFGAYWASDICDALKQRYNDVSQVSTYWDYAGNDNNNRWLINNYSPIRSYGYATSIYDIASKAHEKQPLIASVQTVFPNRYMSELALFVPSYGLHQEWDGIIWNYYLQGFSDTEQNVVDSAQWSQHSKNPALMSMMPSMANIFRNGLVKKALNTLKIQQSESRANLIPRMENFWGNYAIPTYFPGYAMVMNKVVIDSINAQNPSQVNDIGFPAQTPGEIVTDTREIDWEYNSGVLTVNSPTVQAASGFLARSSGAITDNMSVTSSTQNETATIVWTGVLPNQKLDSVGRTFLTVSSRSEPSDWKWLDSSRAEGWGKAPMLMDVVKARIAFKLNQSVKAVRVLPLDEKGQKLSEPFFATKSGDEFRITIDQSQTKTPWFSLEQQDNTNSVEDLQNENGLNTGVVADSYNLNIMPNIVQNNVKIKLENKFLEKSIHDLPIANSKIELINSLGQTVALLHKGLFYAGSGVIADLSQFENGSYFIKFSCNKGSSILKPIIIQK